jgi:enoyl-CoA hydratase
MTAPRADEPPKTVPDDMDALQVDVDDAVAWLTLDRPDKRNALDATLRDELTATLEAVDEAPGVRAVVLAGAGGNFAAGADVTEFLDRTPDEQREAMEEGRLYDVVADLGKPVIAAIEGYCLGGGNELALACDVRVAAPDAHLGQPEIRLGLIPGGGATQRLPRLVGSGHAARLVLTGDVVPAPEAEEMGLVDLVVDPGELEETVASLASRMADKSPVALAQAKEALRTAEETTLPDGLDRERDLFAQLFDTEDMEEGVTAFLEDRDPEWTGR